MSPPHTIHTHTDVLALELPLEATVQFLVSTPSITSPRMPPPRARASSIEFRTLKKKDVRHVGLVRAERPEPEGHAEECDPGAKIAAGDAAEAGEASAGADG
jgi:hypothetical protein